MTFHRGVYASQRVGYCTIARLYDTRWWVRASSYGRTCDVCERLRLAHQLCLFRRLCLFHQRQRSMHTNHEYKGYQLLTT